MEKEGLNDPQLELLVSFLLTTASCVVVAMSRTNSNKEENVGTSKLRDQQKYGEMTSRSCSVSSRWHTYPTYEEPRFNL